MKRSVGCITVVGELIVAIRLSLPPHAAQSSKARDPDKFSSLSCTMNYRECQVKDWKAGHKKDCGRPLLSDHSSTFEDSSETLKPSASHFSQLVSTSLRFDPDSTGSLRCNRPLNRSPSSNESS